MAGKKRSASKPKGTDHKRPKIVVDEEDVEPEVESEEESEDEEEDQVEELSNKEKEKLEKTSNVVYISGLPHGFYEEALENFLSQYGRVKRVYVPRSTKSGKAKGYAFVQFAKLRNAEQVVLELNGYYINGHVLRTQLKDPEAVKSKWNTNSDLIALDKRIRLKGKPKERLRDAPAHSGAVKRAALKKERARNKLLAAKGIQYNSDLYSKMLAKPSPGKATQAKAKPKGKDKSAAKATAPKEEKAAPAASKPKAKKAPAAAKPSSKKK